MIIGNVTIENNVRIGTHYVVMSDVLDDSVVVLSGTKFVQKDKPLVNKFVGVNVYRKQKTE